MIEPTPPFVLVQLDDFDVEIFNDIRALGGHVEPYDLEAGEFALFDARGHRGSLAVEGWDVVSVDWDARADEDTLKGHLIHKLELDGQAPTRDDLGSLVQQALKLDGRPTGRRVRVNWRQTWMFFGIASVLTRVTLWLFPNDIVYVVGIAGGLAVALVSSLRERKKNLAKRDRGETEFDR